jgi:hypothetical protein
MLRAGLQATQGSSLAPDLQSFFQRRFLPNCGSKRANKRIAGAGGVDWFYARGATVK